MTANHPLSISGSHNWRDMGGYRTADGRQVKRGVLFRSGVMAGLTEESLPELRKLGIAAIFDLRCNYEREKRPTKWHEVEKVDYHTRDYDMALSDFDRMVRDGTATPDAVGKVIHRVYEELPFEQADSYVSLFKLLVEGRVPLVFNCTAGKDRTGLAAALILHALGVPDETIKHDYSLTDLVIERLEKILQTDQRYTNLATMPREHYLPLLRADPNYLTISFGEIEKRHGSIDTYLGERLGVGRPEIEALRGHLLD